MRPDSNGEANQEPTMLANFHHWMPLVPRATSEKPTVAPTMLCVPEMGSFKNVATISQMPEPPSAAKLPSISSDSELL